MTTFRDAIMLSDIYVTKTTASKMNASCDPQKLLLRRGLRYLHHSAHVGRDCPVASIIPLIRPAAAPSPTGEKAVGHPESSPAGEKVPAGRMRGDTSCVDANVDGVPGNPARIRGYCSRTGQSL